MLFTCSVDPSTIKFIKSSVGRMPPDKRSTGLLLDELARFCASHNFPNFPR